MRDIKGQETAKRVLKVAATCGHNLLIVGPPSLGESVVDMRLPGIVPPLAPTEALNYHPLNQSK